MNQLDDFEKYLRDQLKGHAEPDPLMWKRLTDVIGRVEPWYAKALFKHALTAFVAMTIGAISTYMIMDQNKIVQKVSAHTKNLKQNSEHSALKPKQPLAQSHLSSGLIQLSTGQLIQSKETYPLIEAIAPANSQTASDSQDANVHLAAAMNDNTLTTAELLPLKPGQITKPLQTLQQMRRAVPGVRRVGLSIASGHLQQTLPTFNYQLGPDGQHSAQNALAASPLLQFQFQIHKNWHLNLGVQFQKQTLTEHFTNTDIFSYDDKEHFLFPYLYGYRQISDEELHEGPWPFGPNPPGGGEVSHVKASFSSTLQTQRIYIPFTLSFHQNLGPFEAQLHTGLALLFNYNAQNTLRIPGYGTSTLQLSALPNRLQTFAQSQLRFTYNANRHLGVFIQPQISAGLIKEQYLHTYALRAQTSSFAAGLSWKF